MDIGIFMPPVASSWQVVRRAEELDALKDFTPITSVVDGPIAIAAHTSYPGNSIKDLIDLAKANPGKYSYGTNGIGGEDRTAIAGMNRGAKITGEK